MSTASQGTRREHRVRDDLAAVGWVPIMRAAASKGPADLLLAHPVHGPVLVQVGTENKNPGPAERARLLEAAALCRAIPVVARCRPRKPIEYRLVTDTTPRHWPVWDPSPVADVVLLEPLEEVA